MLAQNKLATLFSPIPLFHLLQPPLSIIYPFSVISWHSHRRIVGKKQQLHEMPFNPSSLHHLHAVEIELNLKSNNSFGFPSFPSLATRTRTRNCNSYKRFKNKTNTFSFLFFALSSQVPSGRKLAAILFCSVLLQKIWLPSRSFTNTNVIIYY